MDTGEMVFGKEWIIGFGRPILLPGKREWREESKNLIINEIFPHSEAEGERFMNTDKDLWENGQKFNILPNSRKKAG
jgi:hypothetical protein